MRLPRHAELWLPGLLSARRRRTITEKRVEIFFCIADHFEPGRDGVPLAAQRARVEPWTRLLPQLAAKFRDADGRPPQHTFFYPAEEYHRAHLDDLARLCGAGLGEVEIHLHHDGDTEASLREKLEVFKGRLTEHGLLCRDRRGGGARYGFIHGDWALDNSRRDRRLCGVDNELTVLAETGCYADFTLPSAPSETQTRTVNRIYYAIDDPAAPKSHDRGQTAAVGKVENTGLLLIQGPLALDWRSRKWGVLPRLDNGSLHGVYPPTLERFRLWLDAGVGVAGRPQWVFIKVYTHGCVEENARVLLGETMEEFHRDIGRHFNDGERYRLHYVTAREMANLVHAAEAGEEGDPNRFRDYRFARGAATAA